MGAKSKAKVESDATSILQGAPPDELRAYCPDLEQWPRSWMYEERDLSHGQQMVECFKPFLRHLLSAGPSRKTLRSHRDNLWILGGEIISKLHEDPRLRKRPTDQIVLAVLDDEGGPLISHGGSEVSSALSTRPAESSFAFSKSATREAHRLSGYGHVDNARALPTCPQPQTTNTKSKPRLRQPRTKSPTDSPEEARK